MKARHLGTIETREGRRRHSSTDRPEGSESRSKNVRQPYRGRHITMLGGGGVSVATKEPQRAEGRRATHSRHNQKDHDQNPFVETLQRVPRARLKDSELQEIQWMIFCDVKRNLLCLTEPVDESPEGESFVAKSPCSETPPG